MDITKVKFYKIVEKKYLFLSISTIAILIGFFCMGFRFFQGKPTMNMGLDFTGGMSLLVKFDALDNEIKAAQVNHQQARGIQVKFISQIREELKSFNLDQSRIQATQDNEIIIRTPVMNADLREKVLTALRARLGNLTLLESYEIGPTIGSELKENALWLLFFCAIGMTLYITWRFEFVFGVAALLSLLHDALFTISIASIFFMEIDTAFIAAILTILGYSINDTIVVYDRIRENIPLGKKVQFDFSRIVNISTGQVLRRSIYTSLTVLISIIPILAFGGTTIKGFSWVLFAGIASGTYSSIFVAIPFLIIFSPKEYAK